MVKFEFWVECPSWTTGGYANAHFADNAKEAKRIIGEWQKAGSRVRLLSIKEISAREFEDDYMGLD